mgnify:CR=1 FL=1
MNNPLTSLLAAPERDALLADIDAIVGAVPEPSDVMRMRGILPAELLSAANVLLGIVLGTRKARRLGKAHTGWWYTVAGAEQATHPKIASHHATRFAGCRHVVEVCTGVGMDATALAGCATRVTTFEADAVTAALATGNLRASGIDNVEVRNEAVDAQTVLAAFDGLWADPSRRGADGRRTTSTREYSPLLETLVAIGEQQPNAIVGIKCGPGDLMPHMVRDSFASEFIGYHGECRERILWKNARVPPLAVYLADAAKRWSPHDTSLVSPRDTSIAPSPDAHLPGSILLGDIVFEPHAALVASGAVGKFFSEHTLRPIHEKIAYAIGSRETTNLDALLDWADAFEIVRVDVGVSEKRIQENLRELNWSSRTEFKKRGWSGEPEELRRKLSFASSDHFGVVIIARTDHGHLTMYCRRLPRASIEVGRESP